MFDCVGEFEDDGDGAGAGTGEDEVVLVAGGGDVLDWDEFGIDEETVVALRTGYLFEVCFEVAVTIWRLLDDSANVDVWETYFEIDVDIQPLEDNRESEVLKRGPAIMIQWRVCFI